MSSRVRVLFMTPGPKGYQQPYVGSKALKELAKLYIAHNQPQAVVNWNFGPDGGPPEPIITHPPPVNLQAPSPVLPTWAKVKWYFERLPSALRDHSTLIATREGRTFDWRRSESNPVKFGFARINKSKKAAPSAPALGYYSGLDAGLEIASDTWNTPWKATKKVPSRFSRAEVSAPGEIPAEPKSKIKVGIWT